MTYLTSERKQKVFIYIDHFKEYAIKEIWFDQKYNPGIGGTEFQQLRLISELQERYKQFLEIVALTNEQTDFNFANGVSIDTLRSVCSNNDNNDATLIINSGGCEDNFSIIKKTKFKKILFWVHHPFDKPKCLLAKKIGAEIISCGLFQYFSNSIYIGRHSYINNFFYEKNIILASKEPCEDNNIKKKSYNQVNIGFLGNLRSSKGFHILAEYWKEISSSLINLGLNPKLIVIGGQLNPTKGKISEKLKIEESYERLILKLFKNNMKIPDNVYFTGVVENPYSYVSKLDLCVVNPLGIGEAASQTILELYSLSIPVVTSTRYGMCDYTDHINEIAVTEKRTLSKKIINWFKKSPNEKEKILNKQLSLAHVYSESIPLSSAKWFSLIIDDSIKYINFSPLPRIISLFQIPLEFLIDRKRRIQYFMKSFLKSLNKFKTRSIISLFIKK